MAKRVTCRICNKKMKIIAPNHLAYKHGVSFRKYRKAFPDVEGELWCDETVDKQSGNFVSKWRQKAYRINQKTSSRADSMVGNKNAIRKSRKK